MSSIGNLGQLFGNGISSTPTEATGSASAAAETKGKDTVAVKSGGISADSASLSGASAVLRQALATDDVRTDRVAALQTAIASGTYNVSSADVADKLISSSLGAR